MNIKESTSVNVISDIETAAKLLNPIRLQILENLQRPNSASGLSKIIKLPRQKINYHLRELEKRGMVHFVEEKRKGNVYERFLKASSKYYLVNIDAVGNLPTDPSEAKDQFSSTYLLAMAAHLIEEVATLKTKASAANKRLSTFSLQTEVRFASAEKLNEFTEEASQAIAKLAAKYNDKNSPEGRDYKFYMASHPSLKK
ncbi:MAG: helix-turn-helix transcriptional regulator [Bacteroidetes bacterium]|nr:helix-turn-helix transcriptional regulator [Bacteroidota bacterium]